jgi:hypothetical protein
VTEATSPWWARYTWAIVAFIGGIGMAAATLLMWRQRKPAPVVAPRQSRERQRVDEVDEALHAADAALSEAFDDPDREERLRRLAELIDARGTEPGR